MVPVPELTQQTFSEADRAFMALALEEARAASARDEVPIGAVIVAPARAADDPGAVLARAHNRTRADRDPTAHAELLALRLALREIGRARLDGCRIYATVEPCFMCAGALIHARVERCLWGVRDPKFGGVASLGAVLDAPGLNHRVSWEEGCLAEEARALLQEFFRRKRRGQGDHGGDHSVERCQSG